MGSRFGLVLCTGLFGVVERVMKTSGGFLFSDLVELFWVVGDGFSGLIF